MATSESNDGMQVPPEYDFARLNSPDMFLVLEHIESYARTQDQIPNAFAPTIFYRLIDLDGIKPKSDRQIAKSGLFNNPSEIVFTHRSDVGYEPYLHERHGKTERIRLLSQIAINAGSIVDYSRTIPRDRSLVKTQMGLIIINLGIKLAEQFTNEQT